MAGIRKADITNRMKAARKQGIIVSGAGENIVHSLA